MRASAFRRVVSPRELNASADLAEDQNAQERRRGASGAADTPTGAWLRRTCATSRFRATSVSGNVFVEQVERDLGAIVLIAGSEAFECVVVP